MTDQYRYQALDPSRREIRILQVAPGRGLEPVRCNVYNVSFDDKQRPGYEAISYTWGQAGLTSELFLDGRPRVVPASADQALRRMRKTDGERTVWIDAVCINQDDPVEKGEQPAEADTATVSAPEVLGHFNAFHPVHKAKSANIRKSFLAGDRDSPEAKLVKAARLKDQLDIEVTYAKYQTDPQAPGESLRAEEVALRFAQLELDLRQAHGAGFSAYAFQDIRVQHVDLADAIESKLEAARQKAEARAKASGDAAPNDGSRSISDTLDAPVGAATPVVQSINPDWAASVMRHYDHIAGRPDIISSCKDRVALEKLRGLHDTAFANAVMMADLKATLQKLEPGLLNDTFREQLALQMLAGGMAGFEDWTWCRDRATDAALIRVMEAWCQGRNEVVGRLRRQ
ncbi:hypothetical protein B0A48_02693 [Cryoendolithus antarcticus]|uniref:Heterokaryon incompatibility domain-containing protein n=1 Tax=Cryoendolithus antarcticus TaxID=1507870 RepID=A0A1V8TL61_9PEZI|nr:hypothetical protein B0A48_02693 [Cryoendolithus antarcticus]